MKLYIKEKVFSWYDQFSVTNIWGEERYYVEGELFSLGKKLHIMYPDGTEAATIHQKPWSFLPKYDIYVNGCRITQVVKQFSLLHPRYSIEGLGWEITGDFLTHNYAINSAGKTIASIQKEWMSWGDSYELDIADGNSELVALAVILIIDCIVESRAAASSGR